MREENIGGVLSGSNHRYSSRGSISYSAISRIKRLARTVNQERVDVSVMLEFQELVLPGRVKIGCMSFPVRPHIPLPLRSYKCQRARRCSVQGESAKEGKGEFQQFSTADQRQTEETHPAIRVEKMILFIACAINRTDQAKHKTEKIKIIVKGAETFLA